MVFVQLTAIVAVDKFQIAWNQSHDISLFISTLRQQQKKTHLIRINFTYIFLKIKTNKY